MQVFLNNAWLPIEEAKVSVLDRGFVFGDGIYEVIPVYEGRPFRLMAHLKRLFRSLREIRLTNPYTLDNWQAMIKQLIERNGNQNLSIYIQVTRGVAPRDHTFPETTPTVLAMANALSETPRAVLEEGVKAILLEDIRWLRCDIKSISLLANVLLRQKAAEEGAKEAILIRDGFLTEGAASSVFIVKNGTVFSPPFAPTLLPGVTAALIASLARQYAIPLIFRPIAEHEVQQADEVLLISSIREILPVTILDQDKVGSGKPGPLFWQIYDLYQGAKKLSDEALDVFFQDFLNHA
jgi:D-alanine transaminase